MKIIFSQREAKQLEITPRSHVAKLQNDKADAVEIVIAERKISRMKKSLFKKVKHLFKSNSSDERC